MAGRDASGKLDADDECGTIRSSYPTPASFDSFCRHCSKIVPPVPKDMRWAFWYVFPLLGQILKLRISPSLIFERDDFASPLLSGSL